MNKTIKLLKILILTFVLLSCKKQEIKIVQTVPETLANTPKKLVTKFSGNFFGVSNGKEIYVTLSSLQNSEMINGTLIMDGEKAKISATEINGICSGKITENNSDKTYQIGMNFVDDNLHFAITFPEYENQVLTLILSKTKGKLIKAITKRNEERNSNLIGIWRFTEVLSSGSGEFYTSFSTNYFLQFKSNGECISWTGKSAGGSNDVSIKDDGKSNVDVAQWQTKGNNVVFINPTTNKEISIPFYTEESRMILKDNLNRVYTRINY